MIPKTMRSFVMDVIRATENETLRWREGDGNAFFCDHKDFTLHVGEYFDADREIDSFYFRMRGAGRNLGFSVWENEDEDDFRLLKSLYENISVNAADVSEVLKDFFK